MSEHPTPGPWHVEAFQGTDAGFSVCSSQNITIMTWGRSGNRANARLIAAAPTQHKALYKLARMALLTERYHMDVNWREVVDEGLAAIALASPQEVGTTNG